MRGRRVAVFLVAADAAFRPLAVARVRLRFSNDLGLLRSEVAALARRAGLPLYCGEWGALPAAPRGPRLRWYRDVRSVLEDGSQAGRMVTIVDNASGDGSVDKLRAFKDKVVGKLTGGLAGMAKARKVTVLTGVGTFVDAHHLGVAGVADADLLVARVGLVTTLVARGDGADTLDRLEDRLHAPEAAPGKGCDRQFGIARCELSVFRLVFIRGGIGRVKYSSSGQRQYCNYSRDLAFHKRAPVNDSML